MPAARTGKKDPKGEDEVTDETIRLVVKESKEISERLDRVDYSFLKKR